MNNAPIEAPVTAPYTIINIEGGMIIPMAPELINKPIGNARPYPWATIAGNIVLPTAITVAGLDPEMAEKNIALVTVVTPKPPVTGRINGRSMGSVIGEIEKVMAAPDLLPKGMYYELGGLYQQQQIAFRDRRGTVSHHHDQTP